MLSYCKLLSNIEQRVPHTLRWFSNKWNASWEHRHNHKPDSSERAPDGLPHQIEWTVKICEIGFRCFRPCNDHKQKSSTKNKITRYWYSKNVFNVQVLSVSITIKVATRRPFCFNYHQRCHNQALLSSATSFLPSFKDINGIIHHHSTTWKMHLHSIQCEFNFKFSLGTAWYLTVTQTKSVPYSTKFEKHVFWIKWKSVHTMETRKNKHLSSEALKRWSRACCFSYNNLTFS